MRFLFFFVFVMKLFIAKSQYINKVNCCSARQRSRSLARRIGGDIKVDTAYIGGSRFVMTLPIK